MIGLPSNEGMVRDAILGRALGGDLRTGVLLRLRCHEAAIRARAKAQLGFGRPFTMAVAPPVPDVAPFVLVNSPRPEHLRLAGRAGEGR